MKKNDFKMNIVDNEYIFYEFYEVAIMLTAQSITYKSYYKQQLIEIKKNDITSIKLSLFWRKGALYKQIEIKVKSKSKFFDHVYIIELENIDKIDELFNAFNQFYIDKIKVPFNYNKYTEFLNQEKKLSEFKANFLIFLPFLFIIIYYFLHSQPK